MRWEKRFLAPGETDPPPITRIAWCLAVRGVQVLSRLFGSACPEQAGRVVVRTVAVSPGCGRRGFQASCRRSGLSGAGYIAPAGDLGPWTGLLGRLGIGPHAPGAAMIFVGYGIVFLGMLITGTCARWFLSALARTRLTI